MKDVTCINVLDKCMQHVTVKMLCSPQTVRSKHMTRQMLTSW